MSNEFCFAAVPAAELMAREPLSFAARSFRKSVILFFFDTWLAGRLKLENEHPDGTDTNYSLADKSMKKFEEAEELFREHFAACDSPSIFRACLISSHRCSDSWKMAVPLLSLSFLQLWTGLAEAEHVMENATDGP